MKFVDRDTYQTIELHQIGTSGEFTNQMGDPYIVDSLTGRCYRRTLTSSILGFNLFG